MRNVIIAIVSAIALITFGYQVYSIGYSDALREVDTYGKEYVTSANAYGVEQLLTPDGNIWNCGLEVVPEGSYTVVFGDMGTPETVEDDIIIDFWLN